MRTPSIRTLTAIAYERGEEFDPALMLSPALAEQLDSSTATGTTVLAPSPVEEQRCRREPSRESDADTAPGWLEANDLAPRLLDTRHGELLAELVR